MKVLYETSYLGYNYADPRFHTGIPRVIIEFLDHLPEQPDVWPRFAATQEYIAQLGLEWYIWKHKLYTSSNLQRVWEHRWMPEAVMQLFSAMFPYRDTPLASDSMARRGLRSVFRLLMRQARRVPIAGDYDVYHSLYFALPSPSETQSRVRVLSVYDLIPVLFPHFFPNNFDTEYFAAVMKSAVGKTDWVICLSESARHDYCSFTGKDPQQVFVIPPGADMTVFYPERDVARVARIKARYGLPEGQYALGLFTIEPRKNVQHLIDTFVQLVAQERLPDTHLVLVGTKGWAVERIYDKVAENEVYRRCVRFTGRIPDEDLAAVYSSAAFFVYPSLYEGFGLPPLEAMQCGVPVLTSNSSSLPEVVGDAGLMVDPSDAAALAQAMLTLFRDAGLRQRLSEAGLARARRFSWHRQVAETVDAYRHALTAV